jgi:hypothetical protein
MQLWGSKRFPVADVQQSSCICEGSGYLYLPRCKWMGGSLSEIEETQSYRPRRGQRATYYGRTIPRRHFSDGNDPKEH